jgi:hypothetical protein
MGPIVRAIGSGVSLIAELTSSKKSSNSSGIAITTSSTSPQNPTLPPEADNDGSSSGSDTTDDEANWDLDEAADAANPKAKFDYKDQPTIDSLISMALQQTSVPPAQNPQLTLP